MASIYSQAVTTESDVMQEKVRAAGESAQKEVGAKEFQLDEKIKFDKLAQKASKIFKGAKNIGSIIGGAAAIGLGLAAAPAALVAGGIAGAAGFIGGAKAKSVVGESKWFNQTQKDLVQGMKESTYKSMLTSAVTAGATAGSAVDASEAAATAAEVSGETVAHTVEKGSSLSVIAEAKGTTVADLMKMNPDIKDAGAIAEGASINVPAPAPDAYTQIIGKSGEDFSWNKFKSNIGYGVKGMISSKLEKGEEGAMTLMDYFNQAS